MAIFTYQSAAWKAIRGLFIAPTALSTYSNAKSGWVYNGTNWKIMYPEIPVNTVLPVISGVPAYNNTLTTTDGTWNTDAAYIGVYTYQWYRESVAISGATTNSYTCVSADIGTNLSVKITSTNSRGAITVQSSTVYVVPKITTTPSLADVTPSPATPSSLSGTQGTNPYDWSLTFVLGTNTTSSAVTQTGTGGTINYTSLGTSATGNSNGTAPAVVTVKTSNNSYQLKVTNYSALGADSYDIKLDSGSPINTTVATGYTFTNVAAGSHTVTITPKLGTTSGVGATTAAITPVTTTSSANTTITVKELGTISTVNISDSTATPGAITGATLTPSNEQAWSASWTNGSNTTATSASASTGTITSTSTTASGTATDGGVTLTITPSNSSKQVKADWTQVVGATTYYARLDSGTETDIGNVSSITYSVSDTSNHTITVTPYAGTYRGKSTQSANGSASNKNGTSVTKTGAWSVPNSFTPSSGATAVSRSSTFSWTTTGASQQSYTIATNPTSNLDGASGASGQSRSMVSLSYSTTYTFTVKAYTGSTQTGVYTSGSTSFTTESAPIVKPGPVTGLYGLNDGVPTGGTFYWSAPTTGDPATSYTWTLYFSNVVYRSGSTAGTQVTTSKTGSAKIEVQAVNSAGSSAISTATATFS